MTDTEWIRLKDYDVYGFDIDHTIAKYNIPHLFDVSYRALSMFMVEEKGYDADLLLPFDKDFCTRGLVIDLEKGNLMKLAEDGTVLRASHGTRFLTEQELLDVYGADKHYELFSELVDKVNNIGDTVRIFENFFDIPGSLLCARLVDIADKKAGGVPKEGYTFFPDVVEAYNDAYTPRHFDRNKGRYFPLFKSEISKFLEPCSKDVKDWLKRLKKHNKKTFIMTSSFVDFASCTMEYVLGSDWQDYFDYFMFLARKPGFFSSTRQFLRLDGLAEKEPVLELKCGQFVSQGNSKQLMEWLVQHTGLEHPKVVYFGDSLRSDIFPSKRHAEWDTVMILEEMEAEDGTLYTHETEDTDPEQRLTGGSPAKRIKLQGPSELEKEYLTSRQWGSLFTDNHVIKHLHNNTNKYMNTLWGYMIRKYSDVAIPRLESITDLPLSHRLPVFNHEVPREWGFYPTLPNALRDDADLCRVTSRDNLGVLVHDQPSPDNKTDNTDDHGTHLHDNSDNVTGQQQTRSKPKVDTPVSENVEQLEANDVKTTSAS